MMINEIGKLQASETSIIGRPEKFTCRSENITENQNERIVEINSQWIEHKIEQKARYFILPGFEVPLHIVALRVEFFFRTVLIQDPAHINNFIFP